MHGHMNVKKSNISCDSFPAKAGKFWLPNPVQKSQISLYVLCTFLSGYKHGQLLVQTHRSPAEIQTPTQWNLIGRSMTAPAAVSSLSSIFPQSSSHYAPFPARKNLTRV